VPYGSVAPEMVPRSPCGIIDGRASFMTMLKRVVHYHPLALSPIGARIFVARLTLPVWLLLGSSLDITLPSLNTLDCFFKRHTLVWSSSNPITRARRMPVSARLDWQKPG
jgi:hypothetical protein